ncbi:phasin family protein [candidate division KSB1 bacterium]|nr:phasin family protein [candidate division KSB1 bacterium]
MFELLKKGVLLGMGAVTLTREKAGALVDELIKKGELAREERSTAIDEFLKKAEEAEKVLAGKISAEIEKAVAKLGLPTKKDFEALEKKIDGLAKKMAK